MLAIGLFGRKRGRSISEDDIVPPDIQSEIVLGLTRKDLLPAIERALPPAEKVMEIRLRQIEDGTYPYLFNADLEIFDATSLRLHVESLLMWVWGKDDAPILAKSSDGALTSGDDALTWAEANPHVFVALTRREFVTRALGPRVVERIAEDLEYLPDGDEVWLFIRPGIEGYCKATVKGTAKRSRRLERG